jgi:hypothetical protein
VYLVRRASGGLAVVSGKLIRPFRS